MIGWQALAQAEEGAQEGAPPTPLKYTFKSIVKPKTLNPVWNEEFEIVGVLRELICMQVAIKASECD